MAISYQYERERMRTRGLQQDRRAHPRIRAPSGGVYSSVWTLDKHAVFCGVGWIEPPRGAKDGIPRQFRTECQASVRSSGGKECSRADRVTVGRGREAAGELSGVAGDS